MTGTKRPRAVVLSSGVGRHWRRWTRRGRRSRFVVQGVDSLPSMPAASLYVATLAELDEGTGHTLRAKPPEGIIVLDQGTRCEAILACLRRLGPRLIPRVHMKTVDTRGLRDFLLRLGSIMGPRRQPDGILDAWWEADSFAVLSSGLRRLSVPLRKLKRLHALRSATRHALEEFEIDSDGVYVYWPSADVHMTWESFEQLVDTRALLRAKLQGKGWDRRYGRAIRALRNERKLRQSDIPGMDQRHVRRLELGHQRATLKALEKLAQAHGLSVEKYMDALAERA